MYLTDKNVMSEVETLLKSILEFMGLHNIILKDVLADLRMNQISKNNQVKISKANFTFFIEFQK